MSTRQRERGKARVKELCVSDRQIRKERTKDRRGCMYCIGHDAIVVAPSAPLSYARSERDYLARRERANIGSYSSRLYGAYVPTGFPRVSTYLFAATATAITAMRALGTCFYPSRGYLHRPCLPLVFLAPREIRRSRRVNSLQDDAIYRHGVSVPRKSSRYQGARFRSRDICKK